MPVRETKQHPRKNADQIDQVPAGGAAVDQVVMLPVGELHPAADNPRDEVGAAGGLVGVEIGEYEGPGSADVDELLDALAPVLHKHS